MDEVRVKLDLTPRAYHDESEIVQRLAAQFSWGIIIINQ